MPQPVVYTDDPDATWTFTVSSKDETPVDWASPLVAVNSGTYTVAATWDTPAATTRTLRVPLVGLTKGTKRLYLKVPDGTDLLLGLVEVKERA